MAFFLTLKSLKNRKLATLLCISSIALSIALFFGIARIKKASEQGFMNTVSSVDLIVGARSGDINLVLHSLFHMGTPTNNIRYSTYEDVLKMSQIKWTIPLSLGDSYNGFRVIGTNNSLFEHYQYAHDKKLVFQMGTKLQGNFEVVLGQESAIVNDLKIGDKISLTHGQQESSLLEHENIKFKVVGILAPTQTPLDKTLITSMESIEAIHLGWETGMPENLPSQNEIKAEQIRPKALTSFLLATKSKFQMLHLRRALATYEGEPLSAVIPGLALSKIWNILGGVEKMLLLISLCVLLVGLFGIVISLISSLQARQREVSVLRAIGASPGLIAILFLTEGTMLVFLGSFLGLSLLFILMLLLGPYLASHFQVALSLNFIEPVELKYLAIFILLGMFSSSVPAILAYRKGLRTRL